MPGHFSVVDAARVALFILATIASAQRVDAQEAACNDDTSGCFTSEPNDHHASRLTPSVVAGQTYFIVVDGFGGSQGTFSLTVTPPVP